MDGKIITLPWKAFLMISKLQLILGSKKHRLACWKRLQNENLSALPSSYDRGFYRRCVEKIPHILANF